MKVQSNQPSGVPPTGYPQDTESTGGSSKFSEVLDKKSQSESSEPSSSTQNTNSSQQAQPSQQTPSQPAQPAAAQTQPQPAATGEQALVEAPPADVTDPFPGQEAFPGQGSEMVARSYTPPGAESGQMPAEFGQGLAGPPLDPLVGAEAMQGPLGSEPPVGVDGVPVMTDGLPGELAPGVLPGEMRHPRGAEFHERLGQPGVERAGHLEGGDPHVRETAGDVTVPLGEGEFPGTGDPALTPEAAAAQAAHVARHGKDEGAEGKEFSLRKGDEEADDELDAAEIESEKLAPGAMQAMLSQQLTPEVQAVERPRPLHEMQQIRSIVQEVRMVAKPGDKTQIEIQLTSKTLDGLQIKIERGEEGRMQIDFLTRNDDVAQLLSRNMQNLSQSLAAHGLRVSNIQVINPTAQAMAASFAAQPRPIETFASSADSGREDRGERGGQGGRQQGDGQQGQGGRRGRQ